MTNKPINKLNQSISTERLLIRRSDATRGRGRRGGCSSCRTTPASVDLESIRGTFDVQRQAESARRGPAAGIDESRCETPGTPHLHKSCAHHHRTSFSFYRSLTRTKTEGGTFSGCLFIGAHFSQSLNESKFIDRYKKSDQASGFRSADLRFRMFVFSICIIQQQFALKSTAKCIQHLCALQTTDNQTLR